MDGGAGTIDGGATTLTADQAFARPRPRLRWLDATTTLRDFALVTFDVDPAAMIAVLPPGLEPETRRLDDGRSRGFVSAVSFRDVDFRFTVAPWLRVSFFQTNYRAYVRGPDGRQSVYFFGTTLDTPLVAIPSRMWGMPWHPGTTSIVAAWQPSGACRAYRHTCTARWGTADVELVGSSEPMGRLDGFVDVADAAHILTHPLDGWFTRPDGRLGRYAVWHDRMRLTSGRATRARYGVFEELGLVAADARPHSVLLTPSIEFDVLLPPRVAG
jgi:Uncharacterized conserved protein (COG2071)